VVTVRELSSRYVDELAAIDPIYATMVGLPGHDAELPDLSPDGLDGRAALQQRTLVELATTTMSDAVERRGAAFLRDRLESDLDLHEAGEPKRALRIIGSPIAQLRSVFDVMPVATQTDWEFIAQRLEQLPQAYAGVRASLDVGLADGKPAARRQVEAVAGQVATWAGLANGSTPWYPDFTARAPASVRTGELGARLDAAAARATEALVELHGYLVQTYAPRAGDVDAVGEERYLRFARQFLGARLDVQDAYAWGWDEVHRIEDEMRRVAGDVRPGASIDEAMAWLDGPDAPAVEGDAALVAHLEALVATAFGSLDGSVFRLDERLRHIAVRIAPPGTAAAQYYTPPAVDFSRPGTYWYPTLGRRRFPLWGETTVCFHEAVPGHHLQLAQQRVIHDQLPRFQALGMVSGNAEGWALYAERLMDELGRFDGPAERLGYLRAQLLRADRVVVDIGVHLGLPIPTGETFHPGERWDGDLAEAFLLERAHHHPAFLRSEAVRYLGWPGQAPCYKLGERVWLAGREAARQASSAGFDLMAWHMAALDLGPLGLDALAAELPTLSP
jgi:uncharacterized protein (DUF885 family)